MGSVVLKDIRKEYNGSVAVSDINLNIEEGEFFTFLGPSGCGKTTLLRLIAGFIQPDSGSIYLGRKDITTLPAEKRNVGMVFQNYALFPFMSVRENIEYGLKIQKQSRQEIARKLERYLYMVGLDNFEDRRVSALSGGEQQRVAFARSMATEPKVLLLDEPLSNLDARLRDNMRNELKSLQKKLGITTIFVTHDQTEALTMSDRVAVFTGGRCIQVGSPEEIYQNPVSSFVAKFIGETNLFPVQVCDDYLVLSGQVKLSVEPNFSAKFISIRPQNIVLSRSEPDLKYKFHGKIAGKQYNGLTSEYLILVCDLSFRVIEINTTFSQKSFEVGEEVFIGFGSDSICALNE
ncbi:MAG: ABC transporter ATP-binding protein [Desulfotalea sp.]